MFNGLGPRIAIFFFTVVFANIALGDITPEEAWEHIIERFKASDFTVSGTRFSEGDTLYVSDLVFKNDKIFDGISLEYVANTWSFTQEDGGNVSLQMPQDSIWKLEFKDAEKTFLSVHLGQSISEGEFVLSRRNDQIKEEYFFEMLSIKLLKFEDENGEVSKGQLQFSVSLKDFNGVSQKVKAVRQSTAANFNVGQLLINALVSPAERNLSASWNSEFSNLKLSFRSQKQGGRLTDDGSTAFKPELNRSSIYGYDIGQTKINYFNQKSNIFIASESKGGSYSADISELGLNFLSDISAWDVSLKGNLLPIPVTFSILSLVHNAVLPTTTSEIEQKVGIRISIQDLAVSETFWDKFDPLKIFDRETFNLIIDLEGTIRLINDYETAGWKNKNEFDIFDDIDGLAELLSVSLNKFSVSGLGAEFLVDGAFSFDNDDYITFEGIPRPEGGIRLSVKGFNDLLQKMSTAGFIGSDEVMGARMLMGMFTVPVGMDELESELWIDSTGGIYANGQRIQ